MENTLVSPQVGEWTLRRTEGPRNYGNMKTTVVLPHFSGRTAKQAYSLEETQKGKIEMNRKTKVTAYRRLGWLMVIPIRLAAGIACLPMLLTGSTILAILYVLALGCCAELFCLRCRGFRTMYAGAAVLGLILGILALPDSTAYLIAQAAVEAALIPALFRSRRVKQTFFRCSGAFVRNAEASRHRADACLDAYRRIR